MSQTVWRFRRHVVTALGNRRGPWPPSQRAWLSPPGKWWTGYGNGPDNSRYFASRQINKSNVNQLQVAWTYPHGETSGNPIVVRGVIYGRGRNGSIVAVDAKTARSCGSART